MKFLPYARLMRLPNVFSAFADILVGLSAASAYASDTPRLLQFLYMSACLLACSGCLYLSGMVYNDISDLEIDRVERPFRPLPSGQISPKTAKRLAFLLMSAGLILAAVSQWLQFGNQNVFEMAAALAISILLYNFAFKFMFLGPLSMALCRFLNMLLGFALLPMYYGQGDYIATTTACYIFGITWFSRQEAGTSRRWKLTLAASFIALAPISAASIPYRVHGQFEWTPLHLMLAAFLAAIGIPLVHAIRTPSPANVQAAVKRCILGLIIFDAILATIFVGWAGLLIALLLIPALVLGKWVYST